MAKISFVNNKLGNTVPTTVKEKSEQVNIAAVASQNAVEEAAEVVETHLESGGSSIDEFFSEETKVQDPATTAIKELLSGDNILQKTDLKEASVPYLARAWTLANKYGARHLKLYLTAYMLMRNSVNGKRADMIVSIMNKQISAKSDNEDW